MVNIFLHVTNEEQVGPLCKGSVIFCLVLTACWLL